MTIFGGLYSGSLSLNDAWVLNYANGLGGISSWTQLTTTGGPPLARQLHTAVYDTANNSMTVFGGRSNGGGILNDVWVLSNANGLGGSPTWTQLTTTGNAPVARYGHSAIYDVTNNLMTIFGGQISGGFLNDVWVLSNANGLGGTPSWTQLTTTGSAPTTRQAHTAVYDNAPGPGTARRRARRYGRRTSRSGRWER